MNLFALFSGKSRAAKENHFQNLVELANIDGHFDSRENDLLQKIRTREGITKRVLDKIVDERIKVDIPIPEDPNLKFNQFYDLVKMMLADEFIHELEMQLVRSWGIRFGYKKDKLDELIDSVIQNIENGNDVNETRERVGWLIRQSDEPMDLKK